MTFRRVMTSRSHSSSRSRSSDPSSRWRTSAHFLSLSQSLLTPFFLSLMLSHFLAHSFVALSAHTGFLHRCSLLLYLFPRPHCICSLFFTLSHADSYSHSLNESLSCFSLFLTHALCSCLCLDFLSLSLLPLTRPLLNLSLSCLSLSSLLFVYAHSFLAPSLTQSTTL